MTNTGFTPTDEQQAALVIFARGQSMVIEAGAGTGKTSTLRLLAASTPRPVQYVAFNKAIVTEAEASMPANVRCNTAHSLAYRAVGKTFAARLRSSRRMRSMDIARLLGIDPLVIPVNGEARRLSPGFLAGLAMAAVGRFCQTADAAPGAAHVPYVDGIDVPVAGPGGTERRGWANNREVARWIEPALRKAWADIAKPSGVLPFKHDHYLKLWQLSGPTIPADVILFDEAQDANPTLAAVIAAQTHAQVVYVGDSQQAIYEWTGAVNALAGFAAEARAMLTSSFRFGPEIAGEANRVLSMIPGADLRLVGAGGPGQVAPVSKPDVILCRTNAKAVEEALAARQAGRRPHVVGGGVEILRFARAARDLMEGRRTEHPDLACFDTWLEVVEYVATDEQGGDLALGVNLVDKYGVEGIEAALANMPAETSADIVISTAHKAKGRQWGAVSLATDFPTGRNRKTGEPEIPSPAELRLLYVAVTRAQRALDVAGCGLLADGPESGAALALASA